MSASSPKQKRHHALELSCIERKRNSMAAPLDDVALARGPSCTGGEMEGREGDAGRRHPKSSFPVSSPDDCVTQASFVGHAPLPDVPILN